MIEKWAQENPSIAANLTGRIHALNYLGYSDEQIKLSFVSQGVTEDTFDYLVKEAWVGAAAATLGRGLFGAGAALTRGGIGAVRGGAGAMKALPKGATMFGKVAPKAQELGGKAMVGLGRTMSHSGKAFAKNPLKTMGRGALGFGQGAFMGQGKGLGAMAGKGVFATNVAGMFMPGGQAPSTPAPYGQYGNPYGGNPYGTPM